jgi:hypothetical protein
LRFGETPFGIEGIFADPTSLSNRSLDKARALFLADDRWITGRLARGSKAGQGFRAIEVFDGNATGRTVRWHPGGGHHGQSPYWVVTSAEGGKVRIFVEEERG